MTFFLTSLPASFSYLPFPLLVEQCMCYSSKRKSADDVVFFLYLDHAYFFFLWRCNVYAIPIVTFVAVRICTGIVSTVETANLDTKKLMLGKMERKECRHFLFPLCLQGEKGPQIYEGSRSFSSHTYHCSG